MCQKSCDPKVAADCRNNPNDLLGDYECRAWNNVKYLGTPLATGPSCDLGVDTACDLLGALSMDCSALGVGGTSANNPTNMSCRTLDNKKTTDPADSSGYCLDDTPAGTKQRANPLP